MLMVPSRKKSKLVFHNGSFKKKSLNLYFIMVPSRKKSKLVFHNGSFKKKSIKVWYSKAQELKCHGLHKLIASALPWGFYRGLDGEL